MVKIKVIKDFKDLENNRKLRKKGDQYEVEDQRADDLIRQGYAQEVRVKRARQQDGNGVV